MRGCIHGNRQRSARRLRLADGLLPAKRGRSLRTHSEGVSPDAPLATFAEEPDWRNLPSSFAELLDQDLSFDADDGSASDSSSTANILDGQQMGGGRWMGDERSSVDGRWMDDG